MVTNNTFVVLRAKLLCSQYPRRVCDQSPIWRPLTALGVAPSLKAAGLGGSRTPCFTFKLSDPLMGGATGAPGVFTRLAAPAEAGRGRTGRDDGGAIARRCCRTSLAEEGRTDD